MLATLDLSILLDNPAKTALIASAASRFAAPKPQFVVRDTVRVRVRFYSREDPASSALTQQDLGADTDVSLAAKALSGYVASDDFLFYADLSRDATDAEDIFWSGTLNLNTEEFIAAFAAAASLQILAEVQAIQDTEVRTVAQFEALGVYDVNRGDEPLPSPAVPPYPTAPSAGTFLAASADGLSWVQLTPDEARRRLALLALTGLTGGSANDLDGVATAAGATASQTIREVLSGSVGGGDLAISRWVLMAGTNAEDGVGYVRPDDYDAGANARVWVRIG